MVRSEDDRITSASSAIDGALGAMIWETSPDLMLVIGFDGVFERTNPAWTSTLGYTADELIGYHVNDFVLPDDHDATIKAYKLAATGGRPVIVNRYRHKDGSARWISWVAARAGNLTYATGRDITDQRRQSIELAERTAELERTWQLSQDMLVIVEPDGTFTAVNQAWQKALGWTVEELVGMTFIELAHPDDLDPTLEQFKSVFETPLTEPYEYRLRHKNGNYHWIAWTAAFHGGRVFANGRDVTERRTRQAELESAQQQLRQSQKMEAMGSLTGGVAHDFNNLLTPIIGSLDMLMRRGVGSERERRLIDGALQSADRAKTLVQRLLAFARRQPLQPSAVDVARLIQDMAGLIGSTLGPAIDIRIDLDSKLPAAKADSNQLEMALLNLAVNARDAMPDGGELIIAAEQESVDRDHKSGAGPGRYIRLSVLDSGIGMDQATLDRAVEPFFSTKGIGKGTGLGLSMVHGLVAQLGGGFTIESKLGKGTRIALWLPISTDVAQIAEGPTIAILKQKGRGIALLVDDESLVRMSTADMLLDLGFEVIEAGSADEALALLQKESVLDLLVTDHLMPGMSGVALAREARALRPMLPVLLVSGYSEVDGIAPDLPRLTKPFRNSELAAILADLLPAH